MQLHITQGLLELAGFVGEVWFHPNIKKLFSIRKANIKTIKKPSLKLLFQYQGKQRNGIFEHTDTQKSEGIELFPRINSL